MTHRHLRRRFMTLEEAMPLMEKYGALWATQGPFKYCDICKCIPVHYIGQEPDEAPK